MGTAEEVGKAANATISALSSAPAILALVLFNLIFMGVLVYVSVKSGERWDREIERWAEFARTCQNVTIKEKQP